MIPNFNKAFKSTPTAEKNNTQGCDGIFEFNCSDRNKIYSRQRWRHNVNSGWKAIYHQWIYT